MAEYLFPDFLSDSREYEQCESMWRERWDDLLRRVAQETQWEIPWVNTNSVNGTPFQDGNPIFSAISPRRKLAVRVVQLEPEDDPQEFQVWTDTFAEGSPEAVQELVISCVLTPKTLSEAAELMRRWITEEKITHPSESPDGPIPPNTPATYSTPALSEQPPRQ